jgi:hypothetical protein
MAVYLGQQQAALGASPAVVIKFPPNSWVAPSGLGLILTLSAGAVLTYSVQVTADPVPSPNGNWNNHDVLVNQSASANSNIAYPVTGVRVNVTSFTSGNVNLGIAQWP